MGAAVVLGAYLSIALLDSVHFHPRLPGDDNRGEATYSTEILSLFDLIAGPLRQNGEKTYSQPFAVYAYAKETVELGGGRTERTYPRLLHGGAHLGDPATGHWADIAVRGALGIAAGWAVWVAIVACLVQFLAYRTKRTWRTVFAGCMAGAHQIPWRTISIVGLALTAVIGFCAALAPHYHVLGTDKVGTDVLYQTLKSIRTGLIIGTLTTLVMLPFAMALGIAAGYFKGWVDDVIQYLYTTLSSIPGVLLIAAAAIILDVYMSKHADDFASLAARADLRLLALCLILGITSWTGLCRLLRGEALKLREIAFVEAARAFGVNHGVIILRHMIPNIMHIVMISIVLDFSGLVLAEAVLSYINIGVDPSMESWGNMINSARLELAREPIVWWSLVAAFIFMFVLVLAANVFADAVRDAFDPRLRLAQA
jgi:peptide/nickel transport system permease protein